MPAIDGLEGIRYFIFPQLADSLGKSKHDCWLPSIVFGTPEGVKFESGVQLALQALRFTSCFEGLENEGEISQQFGERERVEEHQRQLAIWRLASRRGVFRN